MQIVSTGETLHEMSKLVSLYMTLCFNRLKIEFNCFLLNILGY